MIENKFFDSAHQNKCSIADDVNCSTSSGNERRRDAITAPSDLKSSSHKINFVGSGNGCNTSITTSSPGKISTEVGIGSSRRNC